MRPISNALKTAMEQPVVRWLMMVRLDFDDGTVAWNTGFTDIVHDGVTYSGVGVIGSISPVKEEEGIKAASVSLTVTGIKPEVVALALSKPYLNRKAWIWFAVTDDQGRFVADQVALYFHGKMDDISGVQGDAASFTISIRSRLADWERQRVLRYTDADQQKLHPGDKGMEYIAQLSQKKIVWPRAAFLTDPRD